MTSKNKATLLKHSKEEKMRTKSELRGVIAAIVTPFTEDEKLDEEGLRKVTNYL